MMMMNQTTGGSNMNDGGSAAYYMFPAGLDNISDLIRYRNMNYNLGNILKGVFRIGADGHHSARERDLKKIIWFAQDELNYMEGKSNLNEDYRLNNLLNNILGE